MINKIMLNSIVSRNEDLVSSELDDGLVMMSLENNSYYGLDSIGKRVWDLLEEKKSFQELLNILIAEYEVSEGECKKDLIALLDNLQKENIVTVE